MGVLVVHHYDIVDRTRIDELGPRATPIVERHGGELVVASFVASLEGEHRTHMVIYRFPDESAARAFADCAESRELATLRHEITDGFAVIVPELD